MFTHLVVMLSLCDKHFGNLILCPESIDIPVVIAECTYDRQVEEVGQDLLQYGPHLYFFGPTISHLLHLFLIHRPTNVWFAVSCTTVYEK